MLSTRVSICDSLPFCVGSQLNTQVASTGQTDNVNMGLTTATSTFVLPEAPFIIILAVSVLLAIGVVVIIIIMGW